MTATRAYSSATAGSRRRPLSVAAFATEDVRRRRIVALMRRERFQSTGSGADLATFAEDPDSSPADVVVVASDALDASLMSGLALLKQRFPETGAVVVIGAAGAKEIRSAVDGGADAVILESQLEDLLPLVIRAVSAGQIVVPRDFRNTVPGAIFSAREKQILSMVVLGFRNGEIAQRLYLAESTVKSHLATAFRKLGVHSRKEATSVILDPDSHVGRGILAIFEDPDDSLVESSLAGDDGAGLLDTRLRTPPHVVHRAFIRETVILDLRSGRYHKVNATGGRMLELLESGVSAREAAARLAREYDGEQAEIEHDVCRFAADLLTRGLLESRSGVRAKA